MNSKYLSYSRVFNQMHYESHQSALRFFMLVDKLYFPGIRETEASLRVISATERVTGAAKW